MLRRLLSRGLAPTAALTLATGLTATALLFTTVGYLEYDKMRLSFEQRAGVRVAALRQGLYEAVEVLTVTNQLFTAIAPVTRDQFSTFTAPLLARHPFILAFNYHRVVEAEQRGAFEAALGRLRRGAVIREMRGGHIVPAAQRAHYSVVDYLEPMAGNEAAFGLDVAGNAVLEAAIAEAIASGQAAATGLLNLAQDGLPLTGFEVLMPVYRAGAPLDTPAKRRAALIGDTAAIFRAAPLVQMILRRAGLDDDDGAGVALAVYAGPATDPAARIYASATHPPPTGLALALARWLAPTPPFHSSAVLDVAGQTWHVELHAQPRPFLPDHVGSLSALLAGLLLSTLLTAFVHTLVRRARRVQLLVETRTADLKLSNQRLIDDAQARRRAEQALQENEQRFRQLVALSSDWYWEQDAELRFINLTGGVGEKGGVPPERYLGKTRWEAVPGMSESAWGRAHMACLAAREAFENFEYATVDNQGQTRWFSINGLPLFDAHDVFCGYRGTGTDITARKLAERRIVHVAEHDALTGLPNRSLLQDRLAQALAGAERGALAVWILLIDLDRFKFVNDSMGHKAGDVLLMTIAARLRGALRDNDTVARLSGDEFVVILSEQRGERLSAAVVQRLMDTVAQPALLGSIEFFVTCSIGVAVFPGDGAPADTLVEHADIAMYRAKKLGGNNFQFYTAAMNDEALERVRIEGALRCALERREFVLHYQPQVELKTGRIVGMEALIRWQHPELGMIAPSRFIGVAEETGLIVAIGAWVLRSACAQNRAWQLAGLGRLRVAVNLSARQFGAPGLLAEIGAALADADLAPDCLDIELTESLFMHEVGQAVELLHSMKALGVSLSIDDFGTGYSSLSYLSRFPIDVLKIDRSFVAAITRDANDAAIVDSIITLAHNLKLAVIAEGVETAEQLDHLRRHGCDAIQGYYFSQPLAVAEFEQLLRTRVAPDVAEQVNIEENIDAHIDANVAG